MSEHDPVNNPSHYKNCAVEPIAAIEAWGLGFCLGNAVKYIARAGKKDPAKTIEDLEKSRWYLDHEIARLKADEPEKPEPATFKVGDRVTFAIEEECPSVGVVRQVRRNGPDFYVVDWKEEDGVEWDDQHWGHELKRCDPEPNASESKTITAYRCVQCGMPIAAGEERVVYSHVGPAMVHEECSAKWPYGVNYKPKQEEQCGPKFQIGDKMRSTMPYSIAVGVVENVSGDAIKGFSYGVAWQSSVDSEIDRWKDWHSESSLIPFDASHETRGESC